jgi:hypothetical protein
MTHSCQSLSTLQEILGEAASLVAAVPGSRTQELATHVALLRDRLMSSSLVSAEIEHEIVSVRELARLLFQKSTPA